jgi:hypothetical protein
LNTRKNGKPEICLFVMSRVSTNFYVTQSQGGTVTVKSR